MLHNARYVGAIDRGGGRNDIESSILLHTWYIGLSLWNICIEVQYLDQTPGCNFSNMPYVLIDVFT